MSNTVRNRRQWPLQEGVRGSLHRLRSQLAEDGCSHSQLILAKNLLQESESCIGSFENAEVAVHWLIQASDQANDEATKLLRYCLRHGKGISDRNYQHVEECLNRSVDEKQFCKAAHDLFCSLTASSGHDFVSCHQLKQAALKVSRGLPLSETIENNHVPVFQDLADSHGLTLREVQKISSSVYKGCIPNLSIRSEPIITTNQSKLVPLYFSSFFSRILDFSAKQGQRVFLRWFLPTKQLHAFGLLLLYNLVTTQTLLRLLPIIICYFAMFVMVTSTLQILHDKRGFADVTLWTQIFAHFNPAIKVSDTESKYLWNSFSPYIQFFISIIVTVLVLPSTSSPWVLYAEFTISSFILTVCTFFCLIDKHDSVILLSTICSIISGLPQMLSFKSFPSYFALINANFSTVYLGYGVDLNLSIFSICYVIIIVCCVYLIWDDPAALAHKVLLPHIVCILWWQITVQFLKYATATSLLNTSVILSTVAILLAAVGWLFTFLVLLAFFFVIVVSKQSYLKLFITVSLIICPVGLSWWAGAQKSGKWLNFAQRYRYIFIIIAFGSIFAPIFLNNRVSNISYGSETDVIVSSSLEWNEYYEKCHKPAWQRSSMAAVEVGCSPLLHTIVQWQGIVNLVRVVDTQNQMEAFISVLPSSIAEWLRCTYGHSTPDDADVQNLFSKSNVKCHLENWNRYQFEIVLRMQGEIPVDIFIDADYAFMKYVVKLQRGDAIVVKGMLSSDIGGSRLRVTMIESSCRQCSNGALEPIKRPSLTLSLSDRLLAAARSCFTFFFSPLFNYHPIIPSL